MLARPSAPRPHTPTLDTHTACVFVPPGAVLRNDVVGRIVMKCLLSDMPELRLGLNDKIEDITFHQVGVWAGRGRGADG